MTVTKMCNPYIVFDRAFFVRARIKYADLGKIVVFWGMQSLFGTEIEKGTHTVIFTF